MNLSTVQTPVRDRDDDSVSWAFDGSPSRPQQMAAATEKVFPVVFKSEQPVEVRYLGDASWLPATVLESDNHDQSGLVNLRVRLQLQTSPKIAAKKSSSKQFMMVETTNAFDAVPTRPDEVVEIMDEIYSPSCFVRPLVPASHRLVVDEGAASRHAERQPLFYDAGAYLRGDYVEVRTYDANQVESLYIWKRGRVSMDRKNGTYDVRLENGADYVGVRGCHLRHHFRARDVVDCRMPPATPPAGVMSGEEGSAGEADGEGPSSHSEDARAGPADTRLARQHSHGKHSHHHHHNKHKHHKHDRKHRDDFPLPLHLLPKPLLCAWRPAVVLKQEKSGLYTVSLPEGDKEKGIEPCRLMPSNRAAVRVAAEEMRVLAQTWSSHGSPVGEHKRRNHKHSRGHSAPEPQQAQAPQSEMKIALVAQPAKVLVSSGSVPSPKNGIPVIPARVPESALVPQLAVQIQAPPRSISFGAFDAEESSKGPFSPAPMLMNLFDINDRVEVNHGKLDGEQVWLAGRVEAADADRGTCFVRYADGSADTAVPSAMMRKLSVTSSKGRPLGSASPRPYGGGSGSDTDKGTSTKERAASPRSAAKEEGRALSTKTPTEESGRGPSSSATFFPPVRAPDTPVVPHRSANPPDLTAGAWLSVFNVAVGAYEPCVVEAVHEDGTFDARNRRGEAYHRIDHRYIETCPQGSARADAASSAYQQDKPSIAPPSPVLRAPAVQSSHRPDVHVGLPSLALRAAPTSQPAQALSPRDFGSVHSPTRATDRSVNGAGTFSATPVRSSASQNAYRVGARVLAPHASGEQLVPAVVVKKLSPDIYTVFLEDLGEEATFVSADLRPVLIPDGRDELAPESVDEVFRSNAAWESSSRMVPMTPIDSAAFEEVGERSLVSSLDDDSLVVYGSSIPASTTGVQPATAHDASVARVDRRLEPQLEEYPAEPQQALQAIRPTTEPKSQRSIRSTAHLRSSTAEKTDRDTGSRRQPSAQVVSSEKPVSTKALRLSGLFPPLEAEASSPQADSSPARPSPTCTVHFRTHCAPGQATPIIACVSGDVSWKEGTCLEVVVRSQGATFCGRQRSAVSRVSFQAPNGSSSSARSSVFMTARVDAGAATACIINVSLYLGMLVVGELNIHLRTDTLGWRSSVVEEAASSPWAHTSCSLRTSHLVLLCSPRQPSTRAWDIVRRATVDSALLLPAGWTADVVFARETDSRLLGDIRASQNKVQVVVLPKDEAKPGIDREEWLAALRSFPLCEHIVRAGLANVCTYGSARDHYLESNEHGWLEGFGLSPLDLHTGGEVAQRLWVCGDPASADPSCVLRQRFARGLDRVHEELRRLRLNSPLNGIHANLLVLPRSMIRGPLRDFSREHRRQHDEDRPLTDRSSTAEETWSVCLVCDRLPASPAPASVAVDSAAMVEEISQGILCDILPVVKAAIALAAAHSAAGSHSIPADIHLGTGALSIASSLDLQSLLALHGELSQLQAQLHLSQHLGADCIVPASKLRASPSSVKLSAEEALAESVRLLEDAALSLSGTGTAIVTSAARQVVSFLRTNAASSLIVQVTIDQATVCLKDEDAQSLFGPWYDHLSRLPSEKSALERFALALNDLPTVSTPQRAGVSAATEVARGSPQRGLSPEKAVVRSALGRLIAEEAGVRDPFCANEAADCLLAMGCGSEEDFVSVGELFSSPGAGGVNADKLRAFFHEGGIPLFIAAKLAVFVRAKLAAES